MASVHPIEDTVTVIGPEIRQDASKEAAVPDDEAKKKERDDEAKEKEPDGDTGKASNKLDAALCPKESCSCGKSFSRSSL